MLPTPAIVAQVPPGIRAPMAPAVASTGSRGITVNGSAATRIRASSARITLQLSTADRALSLDAKRIQPIVDALVRAGADPSSVHLPMNFSAPGGSNAASISATVLHPDVAQMQRGIIGVGTVIASMKDVILNGVQVELEASNCADALARVRHEALANAHVKAASIARDLGVTLGGALAVSSFEQNAPDGSCRSQYYIGSFMNPQNPQTPEEYVTVPVTSNVTITYAIR